MTSVDGALGMALFDDRYVQHPHPLYGDMHAEGPIHRIGTSDFFAVTGWAALDEAVHRCEDFSSNLTGTMIRDADGAVGVFPMGALGDPVQALATADDPEHAVHRKALIPHLAARRIHGVDSFIAETSTRILDADAGGGRIEWMSAMANRLPMMIVGRIIGVPGEDVDKIIRLGYATTQFVEGLVDRDQLDAAGAAVMELSGYVTEQFERAVAHPRDDLLGDLATACAAGDLHEVTARVMMLTLFGAGGESTASLIGSAAWVLATHHDVQRQLRRQPELLGAFLEEVLRYESPFRGHYRHVVRDTELAGTALPAGSRLILMWGAANRDPTHFDEPDEFRLDRPFGKSHLSFGKGAHFCVGAALARLEATIVVGQLLERTAWIEAERVGRWLPSLLVRRLDRLTLTLS